MPRPTAASLVRLFPPAWRTRYGEEFVDTAGADPLGAREVFDVVMVAIDAWLSSDVRNATRAFRVASPTPEGGTAMLKSMLACNRTRSHVTPRDGLIGAGVMLGTTILFALAGIGARRAGWVVTAEVLKSLAFSGPFMLSMPFWMMKGQPRRAQAVIIGGTLSIIAAAAVIAAKF